MKHIKFKFYEEYETKITPELINESKARVAEANKIIENYNDYVIKEWAKIRAKEELEQQRLKEEEFAKLNKEKTHKKKNIKRLPLQCIETGVVFEQESYAQDWLKEVTGKRGCPSQSARTGGSCVGYHFKYVQNNAQKGDS